MVREFEYTPVLGWSVSRYDTFSTCKRRYYYQYYTRFEKETPRDKLNLLKSLTTIPLEIGNITHKVIKVLLERLTKSVDRIDEKRFRDYVTGMATRIAGEKDFAEVYYRQRNTVDAETEILPKVRVAMKNLLDSERMSWLFEQVRYSGKEWIVEPGGYGECRIDNQKAYCKVDFLLPVGNEIHIVDWKTGKRDPVKHEKQMTGYVTWAHFHFEKDFDLIKPFVAYLVPEYREDSVTVGRAAVEGFSERIRNETVEMYGFCSDIDQNVPLPKSEFPMTEHLGICAHCGFREICDRA